MPRESLLMHMVMTQAMHHDHFLTIHWRLHSLTLYFSLPHIRLLFWLSYTLEGLNKTQFYKDDTVVITTTGETTTAEAYVSEFFLDWHYSNVGYDVMALLIFIVALRSVRTNSVFIFVDQILLIKSLIITNKMINFFIQFRQDWDLYVSSLLETWEEIGN